MWGTSSAVHTLDVRRGSDGARRRRRYLYPECTKNDGRRCLLLQHRRDINEILMHAGLELREDIRGRSSGDARLAVAETLECLCYECNQMPHRRQRQAMELAEDVLSEHHCITAVDLTRFVVQRPSLLEALERKGTVRSVTVWAEDLDGTYFDNAKLVYILHLADQLIFTNPDWNRTSESTCPVHGRMVTLHTRDLTTLDIGHVLLHSSEAHTFIRELWRNKTIADLTVGICVIGFCCREFAAYLAKPDGTLKKLTYRIKASENENRSLMEEAIQIQIDAICRMATLEELTFDFVKTFPENTSDTARYAKLVSLSPSLRRLWLSSRSNCHREQTAPPNDAAQCMEPWLAALRKNSKLNELCIDLWCFGETECRAFFEAVADNATLRSVVIHHLPMTGRLDVMCKMIRELGLSDRVVVEDQYYIYQDVNSLLDCPEITGVTLTGQIPEELPHFMSVGAALDALSRVIHPISLRMTCDWFCRSTFDDLAACIRRRSAHTDIELDMHSWWPTESERQREYILSGLFRALASNPKLTRISIHGLPALGKNCLKEFAEGLRKNRNRNLIQVHIVPACGYDIRGYKLGYAMARRLKEAAKFGNIVLAAIQETVRKNANRVSAAADFVQHWQYSDYGVRYIEAVHDHPYLLELVRDGAAVSNGQAKAMIREALQQIRWCGLDEFMRLAGVVRLKVECIGRRRNRVQLTDIGEHCWLQIRKYLKLCDVVRV